jgi:hypothetical protein
VAAAAPHANDDDKVICKTEEVTGSRFPKRLCDTKAGWDAKARAARDYLDANTRLSHCSGTAC